MHLRRHKQPDRPDGTCSTCSPEPEVLIGEVSVHISCSAADMGVLMHIGTLDGHESLPMSYQKLQLMSS